MFDDDVMLGQGMCFKTSRAWLTAVDANVVSKHRCNSSSELEPFVHPCQPSAQLGASHIKIDDVRDADPEQSNQIRNRVSNRNHQARAQAAFAGAPRSALSPNHC